VSEQVRANILLKDVTQMARVEIEPATLGSQGKYSTSRPPRPIIMDNLSFGTNLELVEIRKKSM
jgi:hypothetical protein